MTPKNYLDFISNYRAQLTGNIKKISSSTKRLEGGLQKLIEAADAVERMQVTNHSPKHMYIINQNPSLCCVSSGGSR